MSFRTFMALSLLSAGPAWLACETAYPRATQGALAIRVHPASGSAPTAPARGSFSLRGIDQTQRARVVLAGDAYQTLHVPLPAGSYAVQWQPAGDNAAANFDSPQLAPGVELSLIVVVAPSQLTLLDVQTTPPSEFGANQVAFAGNDLPWKLGL